VGLGGLAACPRQRSRWPLRAVQVARQPHLQPRVIGTLRVGRGGVGELAKVGLQPQRREERAEAVARREILAARARGAAVVLRRSAAARAAARPGHGRRPRPRPHRHPQPAPAQSRRARRRCAPAASRAAPPCLHASRRSTPFVAPVNPAFPRLLPPPRGPKGHPAPPCGPRGRARGRARSPGVVRRRQQGSWRAGVRAGLIFGRPAPRIAARSHCKQGTPPPSLASHSRATPATQGRRRGQRSPRPPAPSERAGAI
jgi:hypothetical protein